MAYPIVSFSLGASACRRLRRGLAAGAVALLLVSPAFAATTYTYDQLGRLVRVDYAAGNYVVYHYDSAGNRTAVGSAATNSAPTARADSITVSPGTAYTFDPRLNDSDPDYDPLIISDKINGTHGSVTNGTTSVTYTPNTGYSGSDSFTYTISDGVTAHTATATVSVTVVNGAPTAVADIISATAGTPYTFDPRSNDTDPEGDALTISAKTDGVHGTVSINSGTSLTYSSASGYAGSDSFTYTVYDGHSNSPPATVTVTVVAGNQPPIAVNDSIAVTSGPYTFDPRSNDSDPEGDTLTISGKTDGSHGTVAINSGTSLTYSPASGYAGSDSFTYTISDGHSNMAMATVSAAVSSGDHAPVCSDYSDSYTSPPPGYTFDPRSSCTDADGDALTITAVSTPDIGTATKAGDGTSITFNNHGHFGVAHFTYTVSDVHGLSATANISITVNNDGG
ncbi:MAG TPA: Ig-like domain-containing protein [Rhizomicrobium sp.]